MAMTVMRAGTAATRAAVGVVATSGAMVPLGLLLAVATLPTVARYFWLDPTTAAWVLHAYLIPLAGLTLLARRVAAQYGPRRLMRWGIEAYTVGAVVAGVSQVVPLLLAGRAAQGIGAALLLGGGLALLADRVPADERGPALALTAGVAGLTALGAVALGPVLTGLLAWQLAYLLMVPAGLYAMWRLERLPADEVATAPAVAGDRVGVVLLLLTLTTLALSATHFHGEAAVIEQGWPYHTTLHVITAVLVAGFIVVETRAKAPLLAVARLRSRRLLGTIAARAAAVVALLGALVLTPPLVEWDLRRPVLVSGLMLGLMLLSGIGLVAASARRADWPRLARLAPLAFGLLAGGLLALGLAGAGLGDVGVALALSATAAAATWGGLAGAGTIRAEPTDQTDTASGLLVLATLLGCALAASLTVGVLGLILEYQHNLATLQPRSSPATTFPLSLAFLCLVPVATVGAIAAWLARPKAS